jgi:O-antigen/teichoic acid export membrane protein
MTLLVFLTCALLAVSGAVKLRATSRIGMRTSLLSVSEMAVALAFAGLAFVSGAEAPYLAWSVPVGLLLFIVSSWRYALRFRDHGRRRVASEGARLEQHVRQSTPPPA